MAVRCRTEHEEQADVHQWLLAKRIAHFAVPNGALLGGRNRYAVLAKLRAEGFTEGAPDLVLVPHAPKSPTKAHVVIEMKRCHGSTVSAEQRVVHETMIREGWIVIVAKGAKEAIRALCAWGY